ncbi:MAG: LacI family DNA-binding transcriptional regulator [Spirochaetia bacterium]|nr:LacI family DNA-binding transcriptional regulator [Spirochaetia bacterium]
MKYEEVEEQLQREIAGGIFDDAIPSSRELARRYGTTRSSVDRALAELRGAALIESVPRVGHRVVARKKRYTDVAWLWPHEDQPGALFQEAFDVVKKNIPIDYNLLFQSYSNDPAVERECLLKFIALRLDGLFVLPCLREGRLVNLDLYQKLIRINTRLVFMMRDVREVAATSIFYDNRSYMDEMMAYLAAKGAKTRVYLAMEGLEIERPRRAHFDLNYAAKPECYWFQFPVIAEDNGEAVVAHIAEVFRENGFAEKSGPIGIAGANDLYAYAGWKALLLLGIRNPFLVSNGAIRNIVPKFFHLSPGEIPEGMKAYPDLSFRAAEIGKLALERMTYMFQRGENLAESISLPVHFVG